jgi:DNA gyrase/topoisomerase IV subunit B
MAGKLPQEVKQNVQEFVRLDDGLKKAKEDMKVAKQAMEECRTGIIDYMKEAGIPRFEIMKGSQHLDLVEKTLINRPSADCIRKKIADLLSQNITDPDIIYNEIKKCGGTRQEWKLARRSKRKPKAKTDSDKPKKVAAKKVTVE